MMLHEERVSAQCLFLLLIRLLDRKLSTLYFITLRNVLKCLGKKDVKEWMRKRQLYSDSPVSPQEWMITHSPVISLSHLILISLLYHVYIVFPSICHALPSSFPPQDQKAAESKWTWVNQRQEGKQSIAMTLAYLTWLVGSKRCR